MGSKEDLKASFALMRETLGLSQRECGEILGVSEATINKWEGIDADSIGRQPNEQAYGTLLGIYDNAIENVARVIDTIAAAGLEEVSLTLWRDEQTYLKSHSEDADAPYSWKIANAMTRLLVAQLTTMDYMVTVRYNDPSQEPDRIKMGF